MDAEMIGVLADAGVGLVAVLALASVAIIQARADAQPKDGGEKNS